MCSSKRVFCAHDDESTRGGSLATTAASSGCSTPMPWPSPSSPVRSSTEASMRCSTPTSRASELYPEIRTLSAASDCSRLLRMQLEMLEKDEKIRVLEQRVRELEGAQQSHDTQLCVGAAPSVCADTPVEFGCEAGGDTDVQFQLDAMCRKTEALMQQFATLGLDVPQQPEQPQPKLAGRLPGSDAVSNPTVSMRPESRSMLGEEACCSALRVRRHCVAPLAVRISPATTRVSRGAVGHETSPHGKSSTKNCRSA